MQRVGFIGLGSQGAPMARRIIDAGYPTTLWARRPETLTPFDQTAAATAESPAALAAVSDLVCVCVVDDDGVDAVMTGPDGVLTGLPRGATVAVHSTVHPDTARRVADTVTSHGCALIDAPVSGGGPAATAGTLLLIAGGDQDRIDRHRPVFETFANRIVHVGGIGTAQAAKILNNLLMAANLGAALDVLELAAQLGVANGPLIEILRSGSGGSFALEVLARFNGDVDSLAASAGPLLAKDVNLARDITKASTAQYRKVFTTAHGALAYLGGTS